MPVLALDQRPLVLRVDWRAGVVALLAFTHLASASPAGGQQDGRVLAEGRLDVIAARSTSLEVAGGASAPAGDYVRLGADIGAGAVSGAGRGWRPGARVDATARFHLDAFTERGWAPYLTGGLSYRVAVRDRGVLDLVAALGVHAPATLGFVPALEVGFGGGFRVGLVAGIGARRAP